LHVDNAIRDLRSPDGQTIIDRVRTDISATLFLSQPDEYEGGELLIEDTYGAKRVKLPAGHLILYPSTSLHQVDPVTQGARVASFFWIQSLVREDAQRAVLFDMDQSIQQLNIATPDHPALVQLTGVYHNLVRMWSQI
jgi:PKHD-type hydroxylase